MIKRTTVKKYNLENLYKESTAGPNRAKLSARPYDVSETELSIAVNRSEAASAALAYMAEAPVPVLTYALFLR
jgi:hypothetical protein